MKTIDMELALASHFNYRRNLIVPNISWGMGVHECDLFIVSKTGYAWEVEIKISKADLARDQHKRHNHDSGSARDLLRYLWFAIPVKLEGSNDLIPERAGIIHVNDDGSCSRVRSPKPNIKARKLTQAERLKAAELGAMRIWGLKDAIARRKRGGAGNERP